MAFYLVNVNIRQKFTKNIEVVFWVLGGSVWWSRHVLLWTSWILARVMQIFFLYIFIVINVLRSGEHLSDQTKDTLLGPAWRDLSPHQSLTDPESFDYLIDQAEKNLFADMKTPQQIYEDFVLPQLLSALQRNSKRGGWFASPDDLDALVKIFLPEDIDRQFVAKIHMSLLYIHNSLSGFEENSIFNAHEAPTNDEEHYGLHFLFRSGVINQQVFAVSRAIRFLLRENRHFSFLDFIVSFEHAICLNSMPQQLTVDLSEHNEAFRGPLAVGLYHDSSHGYDASVFFAIINSFIPRCDEQLRRKIRGIIRQNWSQKGFCDLLCYFFALHEAPGGVFLLETFDIWSSSENLVSSAQHIWEKCLSGVVDAAAGVMADDAFLRLFREITNDPYSYDIELVRCFSIKVELCMHHMLRDCVGGCSPRRNISLNLERGDLGRSMHEMMKIYEYMQKDSRVDAVDFPKDFVGFGCRIAQDRNYWALPMLNAGVFLQSRYMLINSTPIFFMPSNPDMDRMTLCEKKHCLKGMQYVLETLVEEYGVSEVCRRNCKGIDELIPHLGEEGALTSRNIADGVQWINAEKRITLQDVLPYMQELLREHTLSALTDLYEDCDCALGKVLLADLWFRDQRDLCTDQEQAIIQEAMKYRRGEMRERSGVLRDVFGGSGALGLLGLINLSIEFVTREVSALDDLVQACDNKYVIGLSTIHSVRKESVYVQCCGIYKRQMFREQFYLDGKDYAQQFIYYTKDVLTKGSLHSGELLIGGKLLWEQTNNVRVLAQSNEDSVRLKLQDKRLREHFCSLSILSQYKTRWGIPQEDTSIERSLLNRYTIYISSIRGYNA